MTKFPQKIIQSLAALLSADRNLVNCVLEIGSHKPVRAGWVNPAKPILDIQNGVTISKASALLWADVTVVQVASDYPTLRHRSREEVMNNIQRRLGDAAVDRYLYVASVCLSYLVDGRIVWGGVASVCLSCRVDGRVMWGGVLMPLSCSLFLFSWSPPLYTGTTSG
jgi:hypothetical protein